MKKKTKHLKKIKQQKVNTNIPLPPTQRPIITKIKLITTTLLQNIPLFWEKIKYHKRRNLLSKKDIFKIYLKIRKGDIILAGNLKSPTNLLIAGAVTHAALYLGRGKIIHAIGSGVEYTKLRHFVKTYDTIALLRLPKKIPQRRHIIKNAIHYAKQQLGQPYDNFFQRESKHFFCTGLVNTSFQKAGYKTGLENIKPFRSTLSKIEKEFLIVDHWLKPAEFVYGNFSIIFISHNLAYNGKEILIRADALTK